MVSRPRMFSHDATESYYNDRNVEHARQPLAPTSETALNSEANYRGPRVKRFIELMKPRSLSSTSGSHYEASSLPTKTERPPYYSIGRNPKFTHRQNNRNASQPVKPTQIIASQFATGSTPIQMRIDERLVVLKGISSSIGLNSVLTQVSGGPLERVECKEGMDNTYQVELHYMKPAHAKQFFQYALSGRFLVNGTSYKPCQGHFAIQGAHSRLVVGEMLNKGARRTLVLSHPTNPKLRARRKYDPAHFMFNPKMDISLGDVRARFGKLGGIVSVQPVVTVYVSIGIQYADVRSAIRAKSLFDKNDEEFCQGFDGWSLLYGDDVADRPCPAELV